jgi:hypothetical protein
VEVELDLPADSTRTFDPHPWLPSELTLIEVPAGSEARVFIEGKDGATVERVIQFPPHVGTIEPVTGVRLAPATAIDSLIGGVGGVFVSHPILGESSTDLAIQAAAPNNATTLKWRGMTGVPTVQGEYEQWQAAHRKVKARRDAGIAVPLAMAIGSAAASGVMWGLAVQRGDAARAANAAAQAAQAECETAGTAIANCSEFDNQIALQNAGFADETSFVIAGTVTAGTAALGAILTGVFGGAGQKAVKDHGEWEGQ